MKDNHDSEIIFSLIVPLATDTEKFNGHIANVCSVLDDHIPNCYEIVAIDGKGADVPNNEWDAVKGEILLIVDGDLDTKPTTLSDIISSFKEGSDMAFAGQYQEGQKVGDQPQLSYFGIRRSSLPRLHESPEGYRLIVEILGPETVSKLASEPSEVSGNYILKHLRKMVGVGEEAQSKS